MRCSLRRFAELFPWESEDQKKGFLSLLRWLRTLPPWLDIPWALLACWQAQRGKETAEWLIETMGSHVARLEDEIMKLRQEVLELRRGVVD